MRQGEELIRFVRDALAEGKSRGEISQVLLAAGWARNEVHGALDAWADTGFAVPVPRPRPIVSAREAFFYGLMFVALGMTAWHLTSLLFDLIDRWLPDLTEAVDEYAFFYRNNQMRWSIASLIVFAPLFLSMNYRSVRATAKDPGARRSPVRKWLGYLTLFLAAIALLGDLIWVIYVYLQGDLGLRVLLKALVVLVVAAAIFLYFRRETGGDFDAE